MSEKLNKIMEELTNVTATLGVGNAKCYMVGYIHAYHELKGITDEEKQELLK